MGSKDEDKARSRRKGPMKYLPDALLASLNLLGPAGSAFASALGSIVTKKRFEWIEHVLKVMGERLSDVERDEITTYLCSDEFMQLFMIAVQRVQFEHQEEKRRLFGFMLANMALNVHPGYGVKSMFILLLSEMDLSHVETLRYLNSKYEAESEGGRCASLGTIKSENAALRGESDYLAVAVLQKLAGYGMIMSKGKSTNKLMMGTNPVGLWFNSLFGISDLGLKFVEFLRE
jgi:hypothetical protein